MLQAYSGTTQSLQEPLVHTRMQSIIIYALLFSRLHSLYGVVVYRHRFHEVGVIGSGAFGSVAHVQNFIDGAEFAVKATQEGRDLEDADVKRALLEGQLLRRLANSDVKSAALGYGECWMESMQYKNKTLHRIYTSMELCQCSLRTLQVDRHNFSEQELISVINQVSFVRAFATEPRLALRVLTCCVVHRMLPFFRIIFTPTCIPATYLCQIAHFASEQCIAQLHVQVSMVLKAMHAMDYAHLDVKPANILKARGCPSSFKLGDLGNAVRVNSGPWQVDEGDRIYLPGELLAGDHTMLFAADVFSLGISVFELSTGMPLPESGDEYAALRRGEVPIMTGYSAALHGVVKVCCASVCW